MKKLAFLKRKEPLNDTQLLMTITIVIFFILPHLLEHSIPSGDGSGKG